MAEIRELVLTFLVRLSHHALPKNRKRETLDACIPRILKLKRHHWLHLNELKRPGMALLTYGITERGEHVRRP